MCLKWVLIGGNQERRKEFEDKDINTINSTAEIWIITVS
jgi:hypothetical protein